VVPRVRFKEIEGGRRNRIFELKLLCLLSSIAMGAGEVAMSNIEDTMPEVFSAVLNEYVILASIVHGRMSYSRLRDCTGNKASA